TMTATSRGIVYSWMISAYFSSNFQPSAARKRSQRNAPAVVMATNGRSFMRAIPATVEMKWRTTGMNRARKTARAPRLSNQGCAACVEPGLRRCGALGDGAEPAPPALDAHGPRPGAEAVGRERPREPSQRSDGDAEPEGRTLERLPRLARPEDAVSDEADEGHN